MQYLHEYRLLIVNILTAIFAKLYSFIEKLKAKFQFMYSIMKIELTISQSWSTVRAGAEGVNKTFSSIVVGLGNLLKVSFEKL